MNNLEIIFTKIFEVLNPYFPILGGTILHIMFIRQKDKEGGLKPKTFGDNLSLGILSITLAMVIYFGVVGVYDYQGLEPKFGVLIGISTFVASLGFSGTVWIINKLKMWTDYTIKAVINKTLGNPNDKGGGQIGHTGYSKSREDYQDIDVLDENGDFDENDRNIR